MIVLVPEPYSATSAVGAPVMVIGFDDKDRVLIVDDEGQVAWVTLDGLRLDWRYDWRTATWIDVGPYEESDDDAEEETDDGGSEVPGDVPDADGADGGSEDRGEGGADRDLASGEEAGAEG